MDSRECEVLLRLLITLYVISVACIKHYKSRHCSKDYCIGFFFSRKEY